MRKFVKYIIMKTLLNVPEGKNRKERREKDKLIKKYSGIKKRSKKVS